MYITELLVANTKEFIYEDISCGFVCTGQKLHRVRNTQIKAADEMAQCVMALATKPENLSLDSRSHPCGRKREQILKLLSSDIHVHTVTWAHTSL